MGACSSDGRRAASSVLLPYLVKKTSVLPEINVLCFGIATKHMTFDILSMIFAQLLLIILAMKFRANVPLWSFITLKMKEMAQNRFSSKIGFFCQFVGCFVLVAWHAALELVAVQKGRQTELQRLYWTQSYINTKRACIFATLGVLSRQIWGEFCLKSNQSAKILVEQNLL